MPSCTTFGSTQLPSRTRRWQRSTATQVRATRWQLQALQPHLNAERPQISAVAPSMIYGAPIVAVPDVTVETVVGHLPRLPLMVPATYEERGRWAGRTRDLAGAERQCSSSRSGNLYDYGNDSRHRSPTESGCSRRTLVGQCHYSTGAIARSISVGASDLEQGRTGTRYSFHQEPRQVLQRVGSHEC